MHRDRKRDPHLGIDYQLRFPLPLAAVGLLTHETQIYLHTADERTERQQQAAKPAAALGAAAGVAAAGEAAAQSDTSSSSSSNGESGDEPDLLPQSLAAVRGSVLLLNAK